MQHLRPEDIAPWLDALRQREPQARPVLLDVREPWELATARLEVDGVPLVHIPLQSLPHGHDALDPEQPVLALCHHGVRSVAALRFLADQGFDSLVNIAGGIDAWSRDVDPSIPRY